MFTRTGVPLSSGGQALSYIDLVAYDADCRCLVGMKQKWVIEADSVNELKGCDAERDRSIEQAILGETYLSDREFARSVIPEIPATGDVTVGALVVSKGSEETGFLQNDKVPIVTEDWFVRQLQSAKKLQELLTLARERPDRKPLASEWKPVKVTAQLAGYELRIPGFSKSV